MDDVQAVLEGLISEVAARPQVTPVSYAKSWLFELARANEAVELTAPPDSENQIYKRDEVWDKSNALDGSLNENIPIHPQCRRPYERYGGNQWLCTLCTRLRRIGGGGACSCEESVRSDN